MTRYQKSKEKTVSGKLKLPLLSYRQYHGDMLQVYSIINQNINLYSKIFHN